MPDELKFVKIAGTDAAYSARMLIDGGESVILRAGKSRVRVVRVLTDEEFERRGLDAPGWREFREGKDDDSNSDSAVG